MRTISELQEKYNIEFPNNSIDIIERKTNNYLLVNIKYGLCEITVSNLFKGRKPTIRCAIDKTKFFINKLGNKYENKLDFIDFKYKGVTTKTEVICLKHGLFITTPDHLLRDNGCPRCGYEITGEKASKNPVGWTKTNWFNAAKTSKEYESFKVYILECWNKNEKFYKIGRTFKKMNQRFKKSYIPYNFRVIKIFEYKDISMENSTLVYDLENKLKMNHKNYKYIPKIPFKGMQECFTKINIDGNTTEF